MKRRILITAALLLAVAITLTACGESRPYRWAIIMLGGEKIAEGHVDAWTSYRNGVMTIEIDGKRYRTSFENVLLMEEPPATDEHVAAATCRHTTQTRRYPC